MDQKELYFGHGRGNIQVVKELYISGHEEQHE